MIDIQQLEQIDLSEIGKLVIEDEFRNYFLDAPGREHYKLLSYYSTQYSNTTLLDIGSYKGCSALALSYNGTNTVKSFDISTGLKQLYSYPTNVEFIVDDVSKPEYKSLIMSSPFIMLDTDHNGIFEHMFYEYLKDIKYTGTVMFDDINFNEAMKLFWKSIKHEKYDLTDIGHHSGTGLVIFN